MPIVIVGNTIRQMKRFEHLLFYQKTQQLIFVWILISDSQEVYSSSHFISEFYMRHIGIGELVTLNKTAIDG